MMINIHVLSLIIGLIIGVGATRLTQKEVKYYKGKAAYEAAQHNKRRKNNKDDEEED